VENWQVQMVWTELLLQANGMIFKRLKILVAGVLISVLPWHAIYPDETDVPQVASNKAVVITNTLNVRSDSGLLSTVIGTLDYGDVVEIVSREYKWTKIQYEEYEGWVYSPYLKGDCTGWVAVATLNVREESSLQSKISFRLSRGTPIRILDDREEWSYITASGEYGWVYKSLISMAPVKPTDATEERRRQYLAQNPDLPNIFKRTIEDGSFFIGMSQEQIEASLGEPQDVIEYDNSPSIRERWIYSFSGLNNEDLTTSAQIIYLNFQSGYLTSWGLGFPGN